MSLKIKCLKVDTYGENIAYLSRHCTLYRPEEFLGLNKIEITAGKETLLATLNIIEDKNLLAPDALGLSIPAFRRLGQKEGQVATLVPATPPKSLSYVRRKVFGEAIPPEGFKAIIRDVAGHRYSKMEIATFLIACASFMTVEETVSLTMAMAEAGTTLKWGKKPIVDKHCVGGIPGNRTSMVVVPIVAAYGLTIPKTSSRAITSPSGTADTMEVLARVNLSIEHMKKVVDKTGGCLTWGGNVNLSPADDILITVERPLAIDAPEQMVASIMSKKMSAGSTHLVIDIPVGPTAKVRTRREAMRLRKLFEYLARKTGQVVDVVLTEGLEPIGFGIGPVLEARDVMAVLRNDPGGPRDLRERSLLLAGRILEFDAKLPGGEGYGTAKRLLESGQALETMEAIITEQGRVKSPPGLASRVREITAPKTGKVQAIDCWRLARIARNAGAPLFPGAGVDLLKKTGDTVKKGEPLYRIYAEMKSDYELACEMACECLGFTIGK